MTATVGSVCSMWLDVGNNNGAPFGITRFLSRRYRPQNDVVTTKPEGRATELNNMSRSTINRFLKQEEAMKSTTSDIANTMVWMVKVH